MPILSPRILDQRLTTEERISYLGVQVDKKLLLSSHVTTIVARVRDRAKKLHWLISERSKLPLKCKVSLYKQLIAPIWQFALPVWGSLLCEGQFERIQVAQNKILRTIAGAPWYVRNQSIHTDLKVVPVEKMYQDACSRYWARLSNHSNDEAKNIALKARLPQRHLGVRRRYAEMLRKHLPLGRLAQQQRSQQGQLPSHGQPRPLPRPPSLRDYLVFDIQELLSQTVVQPNYLQDRRNSPSHIQLCSTLATTTRPGALIPPSPETPSSHPNPQTQRDVATSADQEAVCNTMCTLATLFMMAANLYVLVPQRGPKTRTTCRTRQLIQLRLAERQIKQRLRYANEPIRWLHTTRCQRVAYLQKFRLRHPIQWKKALMLRLSSTHTNGIWRQDQRWSRWRLQLIQMQRLSDWVASRQLGIFPILK